MKQIRTLGLLLGSGLSACSGDVQLYLGAPSSEIRLLLDINAEGRVSQVELLPSGRGVLTRERGYGETSGTLALLSFAPAELEDTPGWEPERLSEMRVLVATPPAELGPPMEAQGLFVRRALPETSKLLAVRVDAGEVLGEPAADRTLLAAVVGQLTLEVPARLTDLCPSDDRQLTLFGDFSSLRPSRAVRVSADQLLLLGAGKLFRVARHGVLLGEVPLDPRTSGGARLNIADLDRDPVRRSDGAVTVWIAACQVGMDEHCILDAEGAVLKLTADETGVRSVDTATRTALGVNSITAYGGRVLAMVPEGKAYALDEEAARVERTPNIEFNVFGDGVDGIGYTPDPEHPFVVGAHGDLHRYNRSSNSWTTYNVPGLAVNVYAVGGGYDAMGTLELYAAGSRGVLAMQRGERAPSAIKVSPAAEIAACVTGTEVTKDINALVVAGDDLYGTLEDCAVLFRYDRSQRCTGAVTLSGIAPGATPASVANPTLADGLLTVIHLGVVYEMTLSGP